MCNKKLTLQKITLVEQKKIYVLYSQHISLLAISQHDLDPNLCPTKFHMDLPLQDTPNKNTKNRFTWWLIPSNNLAIDHRFQCLLHKICVREREKVKTVGLLH